MDDKLYLLLIYGAYFVCCLMLSFLINGLFLKFASTLGIRNPSESVIRWSQEAKPALGGISFFLIFLLSIASYPIFFVQSTILFQKELLGLMAACTIAFLMGLSDDAYNTKPLLKLAIQFLCGIILISTGTYISLFSDIYLNYALTIFWVVAIMNSINMLDNMDAITTIVSIFIIINTLLILYLSHHSNSTHILLLIGVLASLIGFLYFNWHPSKIFMGDTGSQFIGLFLAAISITYLWNYKDSQEQVNHSKQFILILITFSIPIIDTTTVVIKRLMRRSSPFIGGKDHTTHSLFFLGLTEKRIAILFAGVCILSVFMNILIISYIGSWNTFHFILFSIYFIALFLLLFIPAIKNKIH